MDDIIIYLPPVTVAEARIILAGLAKLPLESSYNLFNSIDKATGKQIQNQMQEEAKAEPAEEAKAEEYKDAD